MMKEILKDVARERGWDLLDDGDADDADDKDDGNSNKGQTNGLTTAVMTCETVTSRGIIVEFSPL